MFKREGNKKVFINNTKYIKVLKKIEENIIKNK